jgi:pimeloyl-ACP methyl ester carboxylesterase
MPATRPAQAPGKLAQWMGDLKKLHAGERHFKRYESAAAVASRLMKTNPRLSTDKAHWLAKHWATEVVDGSWRIHGHPAHKVSSAQLYRVDEVLEMYKRISMPVLAVEASDDSMQQWWHGQYTLEQHHERMKVVPQVQYVRIDNAGHMLHHDQPEVLAQHLERFLAA